MDIATLGLTVDNAQANAAIDQTGAKLDALGARAERSAALQATAVNRVGQEYSRLTTGELAAASKWYDQTYNAASKVATAQTAVARTTGHAISGFGRLNYSLGSMISRLSGISPAFARLGIVLGNLSVGGVWVAAALLGIAAIGGAWALLSGHFTDGAERARAAVKKLTNEVKAAADAMGSLSIAWAKANLLQVSAEASGGGGISGFFSGQHMHAMAASLAVGLRGGSRTQEQAAYDASMTGAVVQAQAILKQANADAAHDQADALATLITGNAKDHEARVKGIALLKQDQADLAKLTGHWDDASEQKRVKLTNDIRTIGDALNPKGHGSAAHAAHALKMPGVGSAVVTATMDRYSAWYHQLVSDADKQHAITGKSGMGGVSGDLQGGGGPLQGMIDRVKVLQALGPSKELDAAFAAADKEGKAEIASLAASNRGWAEKALLIGVVKKQLGEIGDKAIPESSWLKGLGNVVSGMRTGADAANLFGGPRGAQWGNILNTGANAAENIKAAKGAGAISMANFIPDAQAVLSVISLGKEIFHLGGQSHATKDRINEANQALKDTMSIESDIINHNPLQAMLDQLKQGYDQQYASINNVLSGKKNETERNIQLANSTALYTQQQALAQTQFQLQTSDFALSMKARTAAAKGLTFDAAKYNLQISQANEMANIVNTYGLKSQQAKDLALVQNTEMLRLVNQSLTQVANAPTGFFAENYASSFVTKQQWPTSGGSTSGSGGTTVTGPITINVPAGQDPVATAKAVVKAIRQIGSSTVGINGTVAAAMELM